MKTLSKSLPLIAALLFNTTLYAAPTDGQAPQGKSEIDKVSEKFSAGLVNVVTGVGELPKTMIATTKKNGIAYGATAGLVTGLFQTVGRTMCGAFDLATFIIPTKPLVHSEYIWNNFNKETTYSSNFQMRK